MPGARGQGAKRGHARVRPGSSPVRAGCIAARVQQGPWRGFPGARLLVVVGLLAAVAGPWAALPGFAQPGGAAAGPGPSVEGPEVQAVLSRYCQACHNRRSTVGRETGLAFDALDAGEIAADAERWEHVVDAAGGPAAAGRRDLRPGRDVAGDAARRRGGRQPRSGPAGRPPPPEPRGVPQRGARPSGPRRRRVVGAAGGYVQLRLRQHRRRPRSLAAPARELPGRREPDQQARRRQRFGRRRDRRRLPGVDRADPARPSGRAAVRHPRRYAGRPLLPGRRRVRDPGPPGP